MNINGNIELNPLGQGEIQNIVIERLSTTPAFASSEAGRVIYNTTEKKYYMNNGTQWIALATGGDANIIEQEVDAIETAVGLAVDGTFVPWTSTNYINAATSIKDGITILDTALKTEELARVAADGNLQSNIDAEETRALAAEGVLQGNIDAEAARAAAAEGDLDFTGANYVAAAGDLTVAVESLDTALAAQASASSNAVAAETAAREAADGDLTSLATTDKTDLVSAINELHGEIDTNEAQRIADDNAQNTAIDAKVAKAGDTMSGTLAMNNNSVTGVAAPVGDTDAANKFYVDQLVAGLAWKNPVRSINFIDDQISDPTPLTPQYLDCYVVAATPAGDWSELNEGDIVQWNGSGWTTIEAGPLKTGDRFVVAGDDTTPSGANFTDKTIIVWDGNNWDVEVPADGDTVLVSDPQAINYGQTFTYIGEFSQWIQISGPGQMGAGVGLYYQGNTMHIGLGAGIIELPSDEVGIDMYSTGALMLTTDGVNPSTDSAAQLSIKLDGTTLTKTTGGVRVAQTILDDIAANTAAISAETSRAQAAEGVNAAAITAEETRALAAEGVLQTNIDNEVSARTSADSAIQADVDANEAAINAKVDAMYFLYTSSAASTSHAVNHSLGQRYCNVTVVHGTTDEQIIPQSVSFDDANNLTVTFNTAIDCKVVVMGLA